MLPAEIESVLSMIGAMIPRRAAEHNDDVTYVASIADACHHALHDQEWTDLRERLSADLIYTSAFFGNDELYAIEDECRARIQEEIEVAFQYDELSNEIYNDLLLCCMNVLMNHDAPNFWADVLRVYEFGGIPCGWDGDYPSGRLVVLRV